MDSDASTRSRSTGRACGLSRPCLQGGSPTRNSIYAEDIRTATTPDDNTPYLSGQHPSNEIFSSPAARQLTHKNLVAHKTTASGKTLRTQKVTAMAGNCNNTFQVPARSCTTTMRPKMRSSYCLQAKVSLIHDKPLQPMRAVLP